MKGKNKYFKMRIWFPTFLFTTFTNKKILRLDKPFNLMRSMYNYKK